MRVTVNRVAEHLGAFQFGHGFSKSSTILHDYTALTANKMV